MEEAIRRPLTGEDKKLAKKIGNFIAQTRKKRKITQVELAKRLNLAQSMICTYEQGLIRIPITQFIKIAHEIGISPGKLLDGIDDNKKKNNGRISRRFSKRIEKIEKLPEFEKKAIVKIIDAILLQYEIKKKIENEKTL